MLDPRARARFVKNRGAVVGAALVALLIAFAAFGPWLSGKDPLASDFVGGVSDARSPIGPSAAFPLGADRLFRDQLVRLAYGARLSLLVGFAATAIASSLGALVGILAGYFEGSEGVRVSWWTVGAALGAIVAVIAGYPAVALALTIAAVVTFVAGLLLPLAWLKAGPRLDLDTALMRVVDVGLSFPFLLLVMAVGAALDKTDVTTILVTLGFTSWLGTARVLRAKTLQVKSLDFVVASRALGQSTARILWSHVLPNVAGPLIVIATVSVAQMILAESVLSYLGVGISPPAPTWGRMLFEGQDFYQAAPWLLAAPAIAILLAVLGFNLLGEGLRDALDPKED